MDGKKIFTPMILVFLTIGVTDLLFAVDSIPAIFGLTQSAFIVFTANIFALMGLRQLYFLLGGLMTRLVYLKHALSVILGFIGLKLIFHAMHANDLPFINSGRSIEWAPEIPTYLSLGHHCGHHGGGRRRQPAQPRRPPGEDRCPAERGYGPGVQRRAVAATRAPCPAAGRRSPRRPR